LKIKIKNAAIGFPAECSCDDKAIKKQQQIQFKSSCKNES